MVARRRKAGESYEEYRHELKRESVLERIQRKGKWIWRSFMPVGIPVDGQQKFQKLPPYRKSKEESK